MLNVGLWSIGPAQHDRFVAKNRELERRVHELGGMKWLYAHTYYKEDDFWNMFDRQWYDGLRRKYSAESLPSIWDKVKVHLNAQNQAIDSSWGTWALQFWPLGESGEYLIARNSTWKARNGPEQGR